MGSQRVGHNWVTELNWTVCLSVPSWSPQLSKSRWNHYIWEVCSANQWDAPKTATPAADSGPQKGPNSSRQCPKTHRTTNASNVEQLGYEVLPHLPFHLTSCQLTTTSPSISTTFCRENTSTKRKQKMLSKKFFKSWSMDFLCYRNKQTYFSLVKMCWL